MHSSEIFKRFEKDAIQWGKTNRIVAVGDIVTTTFAGNKRPTKVMISSIEVVIGRNSHETCLRTFKVLYCCRRLNKKGEPKDAIGCGRLLTNFAYDEFVKYDINDDGINEYMTQAGLSFRIEAEQAAKDAYPLAYETYNDPVREFRYKK